MSDNLWGVIPEARIYNPTIEIPEDQRSDIIDRIQLIASNPAARLVSEWHRLPRLHTEFMPGEGGETSADLNAHEILASCLNLDDSIWLDSIAGGYHSLEHTIQNMSQSFPNPELFISHFSRAIAQATIQSNEFRGPNPDIYNSSEGVTHNVDYAKGVWNSPLLQGRWKGIRKTSPERLLRLPGTYLNAPSIEDLSALFTEQGICLELIDVLLDVRRSLGDFVNMADYLLAIRGTLTHTFGSMISIRPKIIPTTLENLVLNGLDSDLLDTTIKELVAQFHPILTEFIQAKYGERKGYGEYAVLRYFNGYDVMFKGNNVENEGWNVLKASYADGALRLTNNFNPNITLRDALMQGYGLSGKLGQYVYSQLFGGNIVNRARAEKSDVYAGVNHPNLNNQVLPVGRVLITTRNSIDQNPEDPMPLNFIVFIDWLLKSGAPNNCAHDIYSIFVQSAAKYDNNIETRIILGDPGKFRVEKIPYLVEQ